jgi:hypothetical protein
VRIGPAAIAIALVAAPGCGGIVPARVSDPFAWTPPEAPAVARGRQVASRFDLLSLTEISVEVDNAFATGSRETLAAAEQRLAEVPGVRRVIGPADLLELTIDAGGRPTARPVLARGTSEGQGEAARQRVVRRADALGWFVSANGRIVRFLVDTFDFERARPAVEAALAESGLGLVRPPADGGMDARPLLPDPRGGGARFLPAALAAGWVLFVVIAGLELGPAVRRMGRLSRARVTVFLLGIAVAAAALFLPVPIGGVRAAGVRAAAAAVVVGLLALGVESDNPAPRLVAWPSGWPPLAVLGLALAADLGAGVLVPRLHVGTRQWSEAPLLFVSVRGDLDEPVVLREVRRLTDFLRSQPGVANAWSVADLFQGTLADGDEASRIPDDADQVRRVLVQARQDPAVRLELAGDHHEALLGVRFDEDAADVSADRLELIDRLTYYLATDLRTSLLHVDLRGPWVPPALRAVGRSLLAADTEERVGRICARSGRTLNSAEALSVQRVSRQAATLPSTDQARLRVEIAAEVKDFAARQPVVLRSGERDRLAEGLAALPDDAGLPEQRAVLAAVFGGRLPEPALAGAAQALHRRLEILRRRHTARINFRDMLYGADLPTEGVLADEVRSATLEAMGPVVGVPVGAGSAGALSVDAAPVGGAANERALSDAWAPALRRGGARAAALPHGRRPRRRMAADRAGACGGGGATRGDPA